MWAPISPWRPIAGTGQNLTIGATSQVSTVFGASTQAVSISAIGGNCHIQISTNPTATGTEMLVKASDPPLIVRVASGEKIAAIQDGASTGTLNIVEVTH